MMNQYTSAFWKEVIKSIATLMVGAAIAMGATALSKANQVDENTEDIKELKTLVQEMVRLNAAQVEFNAQVRNHLYQNP